MKYNQILEIARTLRRNQTVAEKQLWQVLRNRKLNGKKFLRQHPIIYEYNKTEYFFFIPDFYCAEHKLAVELDGRIHDFQKEYDEHRDIILNANGIKVIRIQNEELKNMEVVKKKISDFLND